MKKGARVIVRQCNSEEAVIAHSARAQVHVRYDASGKAMRSHESAVASREGLRRRETSRESQLGRQGRVRRTGKLNGRRGVVLPVGALDICGEAKKPVDNVRAIGR